MIAQRWRTMHIIKYVHIRSSFLWWPRRTLSVVHIDPDAWTPLPTFNQSSCPDERFPMSEPLPTFTLPTRELAPTCVSRCVNLSRRFAFSRRVNPPPYVRFPMRETLKLFRYVIDQATGLLMRFPNIWNLSTCVLDLWNTPMCHGVHVQVLKGCMGCHWICTLG